MAAGRLRASAARHRAGSRGCQQVPALALVAAAKPDPLPRIAIEAAGASAVRDSDYLPGLIDVLVPLDLSDEQWAKVVPAGALERLWLAMALEVRGRPREAERMYRQARAVASGEDELLARWLLASFLLKKGEPRAALAEIDGALQRAPDNPELRLVRAETRAALEDPTAADEYRAAVASAAARESGPKGGVTVFSTARPWARVLVAERLELDQEGRVPVLRYRRALAQHLSERKLWPGALELWDAIAAQAPADAEAQFSRGLALEGLGQRERAVEAYRKAVALDGNSRFRFRLAQTLWAGEQYVQAIEQWRAIAGMEPGNIEAHMALGAAYLKVGEPVEAFREYRQVLTLAPDHTGARQALARMGTR